MGVLLISRKSKSLTLGNLLGYAAQDMIREYVDERMGQFGQLLTADSVDRAGEGEYQCPASPVSLSL